MQVQYQQLLKEINEKNKTITDLQNEIRSLSQEKYALGVKLETMKAQSDADAEAVCEKVNNIVIVKYSRIEFVVSSPPARGNAESWK